MAKTTKISATSRIALKIRDNFYTIEYAEERSIDEGDNLEVEREKLWTDVNTTVDTQAEDIVRTFRK